MGSWTSDVREGQGTGYWGGTRPSNSITKKKNLKEGGERGVRWKRNVNLDWGAKKTLDAGGRRGVVGPGLGDRHI